MAHKDQRTLDREAEEAYQAAIVEAVAKRNAEIAAGADPDRSNDEPAKAKAGK
jgi:hypothetical protein